MAKNRFHEDSRPETVPEYSRRIQDNMDADSWQGVDRVGADFPEPAEVIEYPADETTRIYKRKEGV
jgi:hypothetical protein